MDSITLHDVCSKLRSSAAKSRQQGRENLQLLLHQTEIFSLSADGNPIAGLLESLIRNFSHESSAFGKNRSSQAGSLLQFSVECFRDTIQPANCIIERNTVKMIVTHIVEHLPASQDAKYNLVAPSFFAVLKVIASNPPHIEQMKSETWNALVQVCVRNIDVSISYDFSAVRWKVDTEDFADRRHYSMRKDIGDLMFCFQSLIAFPAAPLHGKEQELATFLFNFLATYCTVSDARTSAIIALNRLLEHISINKMELAAKVSVGLIDLAPRIWDNRAAAGDFRDRILLGIVIIFPHLYSLASVQGVENLSAESLTRLLDVLKDETRTQEPRISLQLDDLWLSPVPRTSEIWSYRSFHIFFGPYFSLKPQHLPVESIWLSLQLRSSILLLLDTMSQTDPDDTPSDEFRQVKRRKRSHTSHLQTIIEDVLPYASQSTKFLHSLQSLAFYLNTFRLSGTLLGIREILDHLENRADDNNSEVVSWSLICILCILGRCDPTQEKLSHRATEQWTRIWIASSKHAALPPTCRPACAVMGAILAKDILNIRSLLPHIVGIMDYVEQRGPGLFNDNACSFWSVLLFKLEQGGIPTELWRQTSLCRWIRLRWITAAEVDDYNSRAKQSSYLSAPCLRLFAPHYETSATLMDLDYLQSLPASKIGHTFSDVSSNICLIDYLLNSSIQTEFSTVQPLSPSIDPRNRLYGSLKQVWEEKYGQAYARIAAWNGEDPVSPEELGRCTALKLMTYFLSCKFHQRCVLIYHRLSPRRKFCHNCEDGITAS
jgi:serine-protein kinase ATM